MSAPPSSWALPSSGAVCCSCAVLLVVLLFPATPRAQQQGAKTARQLVSAKQLFVAGQAHYRQQRFKAALEAFRAALALERHPSTLLNLAQCYRKLRRPAQAIRHYRGYLRAWRRKHPGKGVPYAGEIRGHIETLSAALKKGRPGGRKPDGRPQTRPSTSSSPATTSSSPATTRPTDLHVLGEATARRRRWKTIAGYTALGVGLAASAVTAIVYVMGLVQRSDAYARYLAATEQAAIEQHWTAVEAGQRKIVAGHVLLGTSLLMLGVSTYALLSRSPLDRARPEGSKPIVRAKQPALAFTPLPGGGLLRLSADF